MAFDLETARVRVGLSSSDTSQDEMLKVAMNAALGEAQRYCNRTFFFAHETVEFIHFNTITAQLSRYPLQRIFSIKSEGVPIDSSQYHVHHNDGRIVFDRYHVAHSLTVEYEGGYKQLPGELEVALWMLFDTMWASLDSSAAKSDVGAIKTISVPDVGSITYATSSASASTDSEAMSPLTRSILDLFRLLVC
jgi:hypothetical protein